jgi:hypothetical protein
MFFLSGSLVNYMKAVLPGSSDGLDRHGLQQVDLSLQVKVGRVIGRHKGTGSTTGHVQILNNLLLVSDNRWAQKDG